MLNARNEHDRSKFVEDLKESIAEMDELEQLRLEGELEKQRVGGGGGNGGGGGEKRDSGITDGSPSSAANVAAEQALPSPEKPMVTTSTGSKPLGASRQVLHGSKVIVNVIVTLRRYQLALLRDF